MNSSKSAFGLNHHDSTHLLTSELFNLVVTKGVRMIPLGPARCEFRNSLGDFANVADVLSVSEKSRRRLLMLKHIVICFKEKVVMVSFNQMQVFELGSTGHTQTVFIQN